MRPDPAAARILVCTDNADDASLILGQLRGDFEHVRASISMDAAVQDFESFKPDVLVLGFSTLDRTQAFHRELCQLQEQLPCRTVILCSKNEVQAAFELCKQEHFDDYVLFWPQFYDGSRLSMSVWVASRALRTPDPGVPHPAELRAHARHLGDLETALHQDLDASGQQEEASRQAALQVEQEIASAIEQFSQRLLSVVAAGGAGGQDAGSLARELAAFRQQHIAQVRRIGAIGIESLHTWAQRTRQHVDAALHGTRALSDKIRHMRRVLLVVEDDEFTRKLIGRMLDAPGYQVMFAVDGSQALSLLRNVRPDIILMDIRLPGGLDGLSLTRRLKATARLADIPIIMMTGDARRETLVSSMEAGAAAFVVKPFTRELLVAKLQ